MSVEQAHQRVGIDEAVTHELQEQLQRVSAGHQAAHEALQSFHSEDDPDRHEVTHSVGGAEEFDAGTIQEEEWPELENMVILGKGLRRRSACSTETGDEHCREQEAADCRDTSPTRLRCDERD